MIIRARAQAALEAAGVEFTNGDQPGVEVEEGISGDSRASLILAMSAQSRTSS